MGPLIVRDATSTNSRHAEPQTLQEFASFLETDWIAPTKDQPRKLIYVLPVVSSGRKSNLTLTTLPMICG